MLFKSKIFRQFIVVFLALSLIPSIITALIVLKYSIAEAHRQSLTLLHIAVDGAEAQVLHHLHFLKDKTAGFAADKFIVSILERCYKYPARRQFVNRLNHYLAFDKLPTFPDCIETFVLDIHGRVIASTNTSHISKDHANRDYFLKGQSSTYVSDIFRDGETQQIAWVVSAPLIVPESGKFMGVLANRIDPKILSNITTGNKSYQLGVREHSVRMGATGETYLVNQNRVMITESRFLIENIPDIIWTSDQNGNTTFIDSKVEKVCGYAPEEFYKSGDTWFGSIHPEDIEKVKEAYVALFTVNKKYDIEYRFKKKDGTWMWVHDRAIKIYEKDSVMYADGIFSDITARKQAEGIIGRRVEFEKTVARISTRFVILSEFDHAVSTSLADAGRLCGAGRAYLFQFRDNGKIMDNTHEWCDEGVAAEMQHFQNIPSTTFPWLMDNLRDYHVVHIDDVSRMPPDAAAEKTEFEREGIKSIIILPLYREKKGFIGELAGFVGFDNVGAAVPWHEDDIAMLGIMADIIGTAIVRKQSEEYIRHMAYHDGLTNLPNRILFQDRLKMSLSQARRNKRIVSVMILDLDKFKTINDTLGHHIGDVLLKVVAERLTHCVREGDTIARLGGDEFIIVLPDLEQVHDAVLVAQKVLDALRLPFHLNSHEIRTSASIGLSMYPLNADDPDSLIKQADIAMYVSKNKGRNTYHFYKPEMDTPA